MSKAPKILVVSLGCPKNLTDTEHILAVLERSFGVLSFTQNPEEADIFLVNTCAFIERAVKESIDSILELSYRKKDHQKLIVFGCLPLRYGSKLQGLLPEVDKFIFHVEPSLIANSILDYLGVKKGNIVNDHDRIVTGSPWHVYVKISDGCPNRCTYCLIPRIRGDLRCRSPKSIIDEINIAVEKGAIEVTLVAQDLTTYKKDGVNLTGLVEKILKDTNVSWLRLMYMYPNGITDEILKLIRSEERICNYLDIPIQHASDKILKRMGRKYSGVELEKTMENIKRFLPEASLRTTVMVGFPGEEEKDFHILQDFIQRWQFHHLGCFVYCDEEEIYSRRFDGKVDKEIGKQRKDQILSIQREISLSINKTFVGRRLQVLVDGYCPESELLLCSRTKFQAPEVDGTTYINKGISKPGALETIKITEAFEYDLVGELV